MFGADASRLLVASDGAVYTPSAAYKKTWFAQMVDGTDGLVCPDDLPPIATLNDWLGESIVEGLVGGGWVGDFPRYVWTILDDGRSFEAQLWHGRDGEYYGYPIDAADLPWGL